MVGDARPIGHWTSVIGHSLRLPGGGGLGRALHPHGAAWALAGPGVGTGPLASDRQAPAVPQAPIAANVHEALDVHGHLALQVSFDPVVPLEDPAEPVDLVL